MGPYPLAHQTCWGFTLCGARIQRLPSLRLGSQVPCWLIGPWSFLYEGSCAQVCKHRGKGYIQHHPEFNWDCLGSVARQSPALAQECAAGSKAPCQRTGCPSSAPWTKWRLRVVGWAQFRCSVSLLSIGQEAIAFCWRWSSFWCLAICWRSFKEPHQCRASSHQSQSPALHLLLLSYSSQPQGARHFQQY